MIANIVLGVVALAALIFAGIVWAAAADQPVPLPAEPNDLQRMIDQHHAHILALTAEWTKERERLLTAALSRDGLLNLQRIEAGAAANARAEAARPDIIEAALRRQMDHQDRDQSLEPVGFQ